MQSTRWLGLSLAAALLLVLGCGGGGGSLPQPAVQAPTALSYSLNPAVYTKGSAITNNTPSNSGGPITTYGVSPALPAGLNLNAVTGAITGTPSAISAHSVYVVTGTNAGGNTSCNLGVTVNDVPPSGLTYSTSIAVYTKGLAIANNSPSNMGGIVTSYSVLPTLPTGLVLNTSTGILSGIPSAVTPTTTYTVRGINSGGSTTTLLTITVNNMAPSGLTYSTNPAIYQLGVPIKPNYPSSFGGVVESWSIEPTLPTGLIFSASTGSITGTPTAAAAGKTFFVTAANGAGSCSASLQITVFGPPPVITKFEADSGRFSFYRGVNFTATFTGGQGLIRPGNIPVESNVPVSLSGHSACIYELVVTSTDGQQAKSRIVARPSIPLTAANSYVCIIAQDGTFANWGANDQDRLLDGTFVDSSIPIPLAIQINGAFAPLREVAAGNDLHNLALLESGEVLGWGYSFFGELGGRIPPGTNGFDLIDLPRPALTMAAGQYFSLFLLADGTVWSCGWNQWGQLGDGTTLDRLSPVQVKGLTDVVAIAAGINYGLAVKADGTVWAWGNNEIGQLGDGTRNSRPIPGLVLGLVGIIEVSGSAEKNLALGNDGKVWGWGGQDATSQPTPLLGVVDAVAVRSSVNTYMVLQADGTVQAWGYNGEGQLGEPRGSARTLPQVISGFSDAVAIAVGGSQETFAGAAYILRADRTLWSSGGNTHGQLGDGVPTVRNTPVQVSGTEPVRSGFLGGGSYGMANTNDGGVWSWGNDTVFNLVSDLRVISTSPVRMSGVTSVIGLSGGTSHSLALCEDGTISAWGTNQSGSLGDGTQTLRTTPIKVQGISDAVSITAGSISSYAVRRDGTAVAWGDNSAGQLGDGTTSSRSLPGAVPGLVGVIDIKASGQVLALKADGTVWGWGSNYLGQLGDGTTNFRPLPVPISGLSGVVSICASSLHSLALKSDGTVWAWGMNQGILGDGTLVDQPSPVQVLGLSDVVAISAGYRHNLAVKADGTLWGWGLDIGAVFGTGWTPARVVKTPIQVPGLTNVKGAAADEDSSMAWLADGTLLAWGKDNFGQMGLGRTLMRGEFLPVQNLVLASPPVSARNVTPGKRAFTIPSIRTPHVFPPALSHSPAFPAPLNAPAQAGPVSLIR